MRYMGNKCFKYRPKLLRLYGCLEIGTNRKMQSDVILELDPKRPRPVPCHKHRKHGMKRTFISLLT